MANKSDREQLGEVLKIYPIVRNAVNTTNDPVVFGTVISSVIQLWCESNGVNTLDIISDVVGVLGTYNDAFDDREEDL